MKVLIVSDTHRKNDAYVNLVSLHKPDMVIHCGDVEGSEYVLTYSAECPVHMVSGNNDFFSDLPRELELQIGNYVSMGNENLKREAVAKGVDIVFYGHTHRPVVDWDGDIIAVNPGSLSYPRQENRRPSYVIMEIDRFDKAHFTIAYL